MNKKVNMLGEHRSFGINMGMEEWERNIQISMNYIYLSEYRRNIEI